MKATLKPYNFQYDITFTLNPHCIYASTMVGDEQDDFLNNVIAPFHESSFEIFVCVFTFNFFQNSFH